MGGGARSDRRLVPRLQSRFVQEPAVPWRRCHPQRNWPARPRQDGRPHPPHAGDCLRVPGGRGRHFCLAAAERLRLRMADLPGRSGQSRTVGVGPEGDGADRRRDDGALGCAGRGLLRESVRNRVPGQAALDHRRRGKRGRPLLPRRHVGLRSVVLAGRATARSGDRRDRAGGGAAGGRTPAGPGARAVALHRTGGGGAQLL